MKKIVHIISDSNIGGAGHQMLSLLDATHGLSREAYDITVILPHDAKLIPSLQGQGTQYTTVGGLAEKSFSTTAVKEILQVLKKIRPDIVHTHGVLSGRVAGKLYGRCKIVYTRHSVFAPAAWQTKFPGRMLAGFVNNFFSHRIISVSPAAADNLVAVGTNPAKITNIYNGMRPVVATDIDLRAKYDIPANALVVAQIARLTPVKGHDYVLDAAKSLLGSNVIFLLAGDGEYKEHLQKRIQEENITNVRLLGFITQVEEILQLMDIQISASYGTEATSLALVQGMSLGKPGVVSDFGGNPYVIQHGKNGLVVPQRNAQALAEGILIVEKNPAQYRAQALAIYEQNFTQAKMIQSTAAVYESLG